jgi:[glutamine synthetase] adenylyltransferase / [glutamine synthetase]-adenylyl-L-tyrosine phosphorylase
MTAAGDVRDLLLASEISPSRVAELLRPYGFPDPLAADRELQAVAPDPATRERLAAILPQVLASFSDSADPNAGLRNLERFTRASGSAVRLVAHLTDDRRMLDVLGTAFGSSPFMSEILIRHPQWFYWLSEPGVLARARSADEVGQDVHAAHHALRSPERRLDALRVAKRREILHLGLRDLLSLASVPETLASLSVLAEALIEAACAVAEERLRAERGLPPARSSFTVLGLGKLGGGELNFSSDVDLIYLYGDEDASVPSADGSEYFQALARGVTGALADTTAEGSVYRVDLRLRPEGTTGRAAQPLAGLEQYYETRGVTWERLALVKAWPVGGDRALGVRFVERVAPFVYGRSFDAAALEDVRRVKRQIDRKIAERRESQRHVKLGIGGIREIEFACQVLQVRFARQHEGLRVRSTLGALAALRDAGLLAGPEHDALTHAYVFLRDVENKLQMVSDAQVHSLPASDEGLRACALRLGYRDREGRTAIDALASDFRAHTEATHRIFEDVLAGPRLL